MEGTSKLPQKARELETPAGSDSTERAEMEAPWNLGDPPPSWSGENGPSMSTEWTNLRETEATVEVGLAGSTQSAESRVHGEAARQVELLVRGNTPYTLRGRRRMSTQLDQIAKNATRATWGARCGKSARRVLRGRGTSDLVARLVPTHHANGDRCAIGFR